MKIIFHGAAREVGKSCIEFQSNGKRYIMDAGVKFIHGGSEYPKFLDKVHELHGVFISHAHMDHSGALPMLEHKKLNCPIFMTDLTWKITNLLLQDSYHLEKLKHLHPAYLERDVSKVEKDITFVTYDKEYELKNEHIKFQFLNSGHIPGGASILFELEGKKMLYTADTNTEDTYLMHPSIVDQIQDIDVLITENTYGDRIHPEKEESEKGLLDEINRCIKGGGSALVPVFGVGRSQEVLIMLSKLDPQIPIYLDGMARKVTNLIINSDDKYVDNKDILKEMYERINVVKRPKDRDNIKHKKGIVILTTSGMVQGGPVMTYTQTMIHKEENSMIFTGFQANGTNGRTIFEDHWFYHEHHKDKVKCSVNKFDFSAHLGQDSIHKMISRMKPKHLILQHGDSGAIEAVKQWTEKNHPEIKVYNPLLGEEMEF